jgi:CCR4-NOT transcription complex subunit 2
MLVAEETNLTFSHISQPHLLTFASEFPSLSNNQPQPSQSTWAGAGARGLGPSTSVRLQQTSLSSQQQINTQQQTQQQDDLFTSSAQFTSGQSSFRFGNQNSVAQSSQPNSVDEFPPLSRNSNGEISQDRSSNLIQNVGFGAQPNGAGFGASNAPQNRSNGLLNALSGSTRIPGNRVSSPTAVSGEYIWYLGDCGWLIEQRFGSKVNSRGLASRTWRCC